jgi:hypothetical protein
MSDRDSVYLGDGVYANIESYGDVVLRTGTHDSSNNVVIMEPEVLRAFLLFLKSHNVTP